MKLTTCLSTLAAAAISILPAAAAEKNGFVATVGKKTIERDTTNNYYVKTDKTQGLALDVKNNSIREFPEGEVTWTIVVRRSWEERTEKMSGKEKLKALKPSQQAQLIIGAAQVSDYKTGYSNYKDKLEYEVVVTHDGKETIRLMSTPGFAALAKRAVPAKYTGTTSTEEEEEPAPAKKETAIIKGGGEKPKPATITPTKPVAVVPAVKPTPATPAAPATPGVPKGEETTPATTDTPAKEDDKPAEEKPFDFFNLDKKKKS